MDPTMEQAPAEQPKAIERKQPEVDPNVEQHVTKWLDKVCARRAELEGEKGAFRRMKLDMEYAYRGCDPALWNADDSYTVPIIARHINQSVASLYAKNPRAVAKRKPRLEYQLWDGKFESLSQALQSVQAASGPQVDPATGMVAPPAPLDPNALMLIEDVKAGKTREQMLDRVGKTLEILFNYYTAEQEPNFKKQMKQAVRRAKICGVAYVTLGFQRVTDKDPDVTTQIADAKRQIETIERLSADIADGQVKDPAAEICELKNAIEALQQQETILVREGLNFGFPRANEIIPDDETRALAGWIGTNWIAEMFDMTPDRVKEVYKKDIGDGYTAYREGTKTDLNQATVSALRAGDKSKDLARVYRVWDKATGTVFTLCEGYKDYLDPPAPPPVKLERFFNVFALTFNDVEHEKEIFPPSDVTYLRHPQDEYNSARQGLREHRQANRPLYLTPAGKLSDEDKGKVKNRKAHDILELNAVETVQDAEKLFVAVKHAGIDQNLYNTAPSMEDVLRISGAQEANLGGTSGASATESSIAEASRSASLSSNVDDLDEFLSELARNSSQIMLGELNTQTVMEIVGPGAAWPEMSREEIVKELYLDIKAGSSGRPNKTMELANMERAMPTLIQIPGINPTSIARKYCELIDLDVDEFLVDGLPSIVAQNTMVGKQVQGATGDPETDPNQQGAEGQDNAPQAAQGQPGAQPEYPGPQAGMARIINYDMNGNPVG
jgi:hypothetical protein